MAMARRKSRKVLSDPIVLPGRLCGFRISRRARANMVLGANECAFTTYAVMPGGGVVLTALVATVAYWGPGETIPPQLAGSGALQVRLVGGVVFRNC